MKKLLLIAAMAMTTCLNLSAQSLGNQSNKETFEIGKGSFMLNGKPFVVKAAELHYPRIPRPYWEHRIRMCKALGMNTVCLYVFWNIHEQQPGVFNFTDNNDLAAFIRLCQKHDLMVILRPGPYVCAEWEMGGLPWWLLKKKDIRLREDDPFFLECVERFQSKVAEQVADLTIENGGPIIMVQVENEYGSYGINKHYVSKIRDIVRKNFGNVNLFQCDWASNFTDNGLDDMLWTINFGTGANIDQQFAKLKSIRPDSPLMCSEFWSGWFDKWGANHETRPAEDMTAGIDEMLSKNISFSLYMTHGGTNWGHWAGANSPGFAPDVTSYDYDAPISESGQATKKYYLLRKTLAKYSDSKLITVPKPMPTMAVPKIKFTEVAPLWDNLPSPNHCKDLKTMEEFDQGFGSIIYRTRLPKSSKQFVLTLNEAHDFAQIFVNGEYIGKIDRRLGEKRLSLQVLPEGGQLDILVEAMGRINFGRAIKDFKGIVGDATITIDMDGKDFVHSLKNWEVYNLHDTYDFYKQMRFEPIDNASELPIGAYRATFNLKRTADTFLNFETWGKGLVYVNGHAIGRIWNIGPQQTLFVPGCWLKKGVNEILVFDIIGPHKAETEGLCAPILDKLSIKKPLIHREEGQQLDLSSVQPVITTAFKPGNGWQEIKLNQPATGRFICLEALDGHDGNDETSIAELYLIDDEGNRLSREPWTTRYADSEDVERTNCSADKLFDLQESTSWTTVKGVKFPHSVVIDLGDVHTVTAIQYLPRMEENAPGSIKNFRFFVSMNDFQYSK